MIRQKDSGVTIRRKVIPLQRLSRSKQEVKSRLRLSYFAGRREQASALDGLVKD
jgi:hypothetical protein